jgi:hypothetical protein
MPYPREAECLRWLEEQEMPNAPWVALDDRPTWFSPQCAQLIECDGQRGFDAQAAGRLRTALLRARRSQTGQVDALL